VGDRRAVRLAAARLRRPAYTKVVYPAPVDPSHVPDENPTSDHRVSGTLLARPPGPREWSAESYVHPPRRIEAELTRPVRRAGR